MSKKNKRNGKKGKGLKTYYWETQEIYSVEKEHKKKSFELRFQSGLQYYWIEGFKSVIGKTRNNRKEK